MNSAVRRGTPDSEALASSEDERPWPAAPSFGSLPRKENSVPGLGGGIWSQKRRSIEMEKAAQRNAAREAWLAAPSQPRRGLRTDSTPSPAASEGSGALPFSIPLQPAPKAGRSMSHSQGQRELPQSVGANSSSNDHGALPLGLLAEEADTESESELGPALTHTTSHPPIGSLQRTSTYPSTYEACYGALNGRDSAAAAVGAQTTPGSDRRFETAFSNLSLEHTRRSQWQTHLGWDDVPNVNGSRRHSLADIPTRRGSLAGPERSGIGNSAFWPDEQIYRHAGLPLLTTAIPAGVAASEREGPQRAESFQQVERGDLEGPVEAFQIPSMYKVPYIELDERERSEPESRTKLGQGSMATLSTWTGGPRPRKQLYIVSFKCSRVEVFYLLEGTGLFIKEGDIVIVEADRGQDLGTVQHANVSPDDARLYKRKYGEEQYKWLMMFSKNNNQSSVNPNAQIYGESSSMGANVRSTMLANAPATMQGLPRDNFNNLKPKAIKRLANSHEIRMLGEKEGNEAKAKRTCQQKVAHLHLDMEILDAEWQWDFQKLIFYYYADHYINFKDLITELYRIYKTRIWLSAINPASFSQHALGQPPSGIGPGAITAYGDSQNGYGMVYGQDPDPYGAVPPYNIGYETYTPNFPSIPGVANSFAPNMPMQRGYGPYTSGSGEATPSVPPGVTPTGTSADYNFYYDRGNTQAQNVPRFSLPEPFAAPSPPEFLGQMYTGTSNMPNPTAAPFQQSADQGFRTPTTPNAPGPGHTITPQLQAPIGTRPPAYGQTYTSMGGINRPQRAPNMASDWSGQFVGGVRNAPAAGDRDSVMRNYLGSLQDPEDKRADEMSRER